MLCRAPGTGLIIGAGAAVVTPDAGFGAGWGFTTAVLLLVWQAADSCARNAKIERFMSFLVVKASTDSLSEALDWSLAANSASGRMRLSYISRTAGAHDAVL